MKQINYSDIKNPLSDFYFERTDYKGYVERAKLSEGTVSVLFNWKTITVRLVKSKYSYWANPKKDESCLISIDLQSDYDESANHIILIIIAYFVMKKQVYNGNIKLNSIKDVAIIKDLFWAIYGESINDNTKVELMIFKKNQL